MSGPLAGISFLGGVAAGVALADAPYPRPGAPPAAVRRYFEGNARAARVSAAGQLLSAASLARFSRTARALAITSRPNAPRLAQATTATGAAAAGSLAASAVTSLTLTISRRRSDRAETALHHRLFVLGGPVHTAAFGGLVGCLAVAGSRGGALPRPLTGAGLASALASALSPLALRVRPAVWLIPAGRFTGLIVCAAAGIRLSQPSDDPQPVPDLHGRDIA